MAMDTLFSVNLDTWKMMTPTYPRILPDRDKVNDWYLDEDVEFTVHNQNRIILKKGFRFDSHSVPWWLRWYTPRYLPTKNNEQNDIYAALVHDALIAAEHWLPYNRTFVDFEYRRYHLMPEYIMQTKRAFLMPLAVRKFGIFRYGRNDYRGKVEDGPHVVFEIAGAVRMDAAE